MTRLGNVMISNRVGMRGITILGSRRTESQLRVEASSQALLSLCFPPARPLLCTRCVPDRSLGEQMVAVDLAVLVRSLVDACAVDRFVMSPSSYVGITTVVYSKG